MLQYRCALLTLDKVPDPWRLPGETASKRSKMFRTLSFFPLLTSKCASRHNGVHFLSVSTSKSGVMLVCFVHVDVETSFVPQSKASTFSTSQLPKVVRDRQFSILLTSQCASRHKGVHFFRDLNFQAWSENGGFCTC